MSETTPQSLETRFTAAVVAQRAGELDEASRLYADILSDSPGHAASLANLGRIAKVRGRLDEALTLYRKAAEQPDAMPQAFFNLGITLVELGKLDEALPVLRTCAERAPTWLPVQERLGRLLLRLKQPGEARGWLRKAVEQAPDKADLWHVLGQAAEADGDAAAAAGAYQRSIKLAGSLGEAGVRLAKLMWDSGQRQVSLELLRRIAAEAPESADAAANLGYAALLSHRYAEALDAYRKAAAIVPAYPDAQERIAKCLLNLGDIREAVESFERLSADPARARSAGQGYLMSLLYDPDLQPKEVLARHKQVTKSWSKGIRRLKLKRREPTETLRVGYLTADLEGAHPVAQFVRPILNAHRDRKVESFVYYNAEPSEAGRKALSELAHLATVEGLDDAELAATIAGDGVDLLIDLSGHTHGTRLPVMAYRPAPAQACFVGYPHSTGFKPVDYLIADPVVVPPASERLCSEKVARLPHAFLCFVPPDDMPRAKPRVAGDEIVFGSLNHLPKVSGPTVAMWSDVLKAVPNSRLLMKCAAFGEEEARQIYLNRFAAHGIDAGRLDLEGPSPFAEAMRVYDRIDIALDTVPYNGGTTTCHALWMGVPVVTVEGGNFCGRMGASFLAAAGLGDLVAKDVSGFVDIAAGLAADHGRLADMKASLCETLPRSPLCDLETYAEDLEALYRRLAAG